MTDYILKDNSFYMTLENPIFIGQSRIDKDNNYIMVFESDGVKYGFKHNLFT